MNLNQLKDIAQKKKGRDVPCDALESALEIISDLQSEVERYKSLYETNSAAEFKDEVIQLNKAGKYTIKFEGCFPEPPKQNH